MTAGPPAWTPAIGRHDDVVVGVHGGGDPQRAIGVRDAVVAGLTDGTIADRASREPAGGTARLRRPGGRGPWRSRADHRARASGDLAGRRRRRRPPRAAGTAVLPARRRRGHRRLEATPRALDGAGADQRAADRARAGRQAGGAAQGRGPVRVRPRHGGTRGVRGGGRRRRGRPRHHQRDRRPRAGRDPGHPPGADPRVRRRLRDLPPGHPNSLVDWPALGRLRGTVVVLMGVDTAPAIAAALLEHGRAGTTPVAIVSDGSTAAQRTVRTTLAELRTPSPGRASGRRPSGWSARSSASTARTRRRRTTTPTSTDVPAGTSHGTPRPRDQQFSVGPPA